ncbi:hypothetical protein [Cellulomonas sp. Leaf395]|uniref:hypothetical protein n=1 Tax=Cellulomonas sp. Leaf395 TaxID=1736362 RepID=UPI0012F72A5E|nr:hypothetical protein [Cellulomonas sp. Leaf395]
MGNAVPAAIERGSHPYWTQRRLDEILDLVASRSTASSDSLSHEFQTGHKPKVSFSGKCSKCDEYIGKSGDPLVSALALAYDQADQNSKWSGLVIQVRPKSEMRADAYILGFSLSNAAEWIASQREAQADRESGARRRAEEAADLNHLLKVRIDRCLWPEERIEMAEDLSRQLIEEGDLAGAARVTYGIIPKLREWTMMRVISDGPTRRVLVDHDGGTWFAVPIEQARLDLPAEGDDAT